MASFLERLGLELPIVQAGMGGGLARRQLAGAVSSAGALGTIGFLNPRALRADVAAVRRITERPVAVNLLLPFARAAHFEAASEADVVSRLSLGAEAVVCGTRFAMTDESGAHPAYKARLVDADQTVVTELFGAGWPAAPHRVLPNAATARWLAGDARGPGWLRALNRTTAPVLSRLPESTQLRLAARQTPARPPFGPMAPASGGPANLLEAGPLYAGECVRRIRDIRPARDIVRALTL